MNLRRIYCLAVVTMMALPAVARGQTDSDDGVAQVTVLAAVDVTNISGLDFGSVLQSTGELRSSDIPTVGQWTVANIPPGFIGITFTLPAALQNTAGTGSIPITFGPLSAAIEDGVNPLSQFDPATGVSFPSSTPSLTVYLGGDLTGNGSGNVTITVDNVPPDTYTGVITLTAAIP